MAKVLEEGRTYEWANGIPYITVRAGIRKDQEQRARALGYDVTDTGTNLYAFAKVEVEAPAKTVEEMVARFGEEKVLAWADAQRILDVRATERPKMVAAIELKPSPECLTILSTLEMLKVDTKSLSAENRADKEFLLGLLK